jgi:hypothetical protein
MPDARCWIAISEMMGLAVERKEMVIEGIERLRVGRDPQKGGSWQWWHVSGT